jgi:hypothetical protein
MTLHKQTTSKDGLGLVVAPAMSHGCKHCIEKGRVSKRYNEALQRALPSQALVLRFGILQSQYDAHAAAMLKQM